MRNIFLICFCLFCVINAVSAQYQRIFDQVIRERFNIQADRKLDLDGVNPYNIYKVIQEGQFLFLIGNKEGVWTTGDLEKEFMDAPEDFRFEQCLRLVAQIYQRDIVFSHTIPVVVQHAKYDSGTAWTTNIYADGLVDGVSSSWAGVHINWNIYNREDLYYTLEEGSNYDGLYLTEVIQHEIFHSFFDVIQFDHKVYPYSWVSDILVEDEDGNYSLSSDNLGLVSSFYVGPNAILANNNQPIQSYGDHYSNAFQETDDKFFTYLVRKSVAVNHLGPVSLGVMKDLGFVLKEGTSLRREQYTGYLFDDMTEQAYGWVSMGDTIYFNPEDVAYHVGPTRSQYPLSNEKISNLSSFEFYISANNLYLKNNDANSPFIICDIMGKVLWNGTLPQGINIMPIRDAGFYIIRQNNSIKKFFCP